MQIKKIAEDKRLKMLQAFMKKEKNSFAFRKTAARILPTSCRADFDKHYQYAAKPDG